MNCKKLKYIISKCRFFIGARTHSTIAAYSTCVPTLVVGYSIKSIGIARDLFGTDKNYVLSVQNIDDENELVNNFNYFLDNETLIKETLEKQIPNYVLKAKKAKEVINKL
ncbi:Polysaccharide pyruvyl transferase [Catenibacterium mitsuokai]|nr:Polysaccharide pyruvyl transferase [Catenibacterium mitsuokai]